MSNDSLGKVRSGFKGIVGVASCAIGIAVVYIAFGVGREPIKKDGTTTDKPAVEERKRHRPVRAMNMALGNMVFFAQDLGFAVKTANDAPYDSSKVALRIENQLQQLREIYRQESINNHSLIGGVMLRINVGPSGEVSEVKEVSTSIADPDFKKAILAETQKWSFADIVAEPVVVNCPLLFVREGMDITTLVHWEKALGHFAAKEHPVRVAVAPKQPAKSPPAARATVTPALNAAPAARARTIEKIFQVKYPTSLRQGPNFSSTSLATFTAGTKIAVLNRRGDWLEVKTTDNRQSGYIRKEFAVPVEVAHTEGLSVSQ